MIRKNDVILFQGDSLTDCGRNYEDADANSLWALGHGYALMAAAELGRQFPASNLRVYNRGVNGDTVQRLLNRWQKDCLDLRPTILSISAGVNDAARPSQKHHDADTVENFDLKYRRCIDLACEASPGLRLVLCEPFMLRCGCVEDAWLPDLQARQAIVRRLADEYRAIFVPCQSAIDGLLEQAPAAYWAPDGIHPTPAGHRVLANLWLAQVLASNA